MGVYNGGPIGEPLQTSIQIGREYFILLVLNAKYCYFNQ